MERSERPAVVFLHGWLMGPWMWTEAAAKVRTTQRCEFLAQPSHGVPGLPAGATMVDWASWLRTELSARGIERAILVGHSMGGMLALETTNLNPELVAGLCMVSTTDVPWAPEAQQFFLERTRQLVTWDDALALQTAQSLLSPRYLERNPDWLGWWTATVAAYDLPNIVSLAYALATRGDYRETATRFRGPAIVIHGTADPVFPVSIGEELASRLRAPLALLSGSGHAPPLEASSEFASALGTFLTNHFGPSDG